MNIYLLPEEDAYLRKRMNQVEDFNCKQDIIHECIKRCIAADEKKESKNEMEIN